ncbi:MAG TPA: serine/threonine-protein kinase [Chthoniobacterales bacterium]|jgi:serine/threonine protein kinase|nr:serine/threonine-protein kinase [Chthoniobacterales bacterium]
MEQRKIFDHYGICYDDQENPVELGRGTTAITYKAEDLNLHRPVALKVIDGAALTPELRAKFEEEARVAAMLRHRNVAEVHHLGAANEHFYYAMEFIDGETAEAWVEKHGPMRTADALTVAFQVARALAAAESRGLTHRDIKPSNIMLCSGEDGEWPVAKVIDFGLATVSSQSDTSISGDGGFHGTPQYASPEQAQQHPVDIQSDVYSLGCTLWFLLTGAPVFDGSLASIFAQHLNERVPLENLSHVPRCVRRLLADMLQKEPQRRPHPGQLSNQINNCIVKMKRRDALGSSLVALKGKWKSFRVPIPVAAVAVALLVVSALLGIPLIQSNSTRGPQSAASRPIGKQIGVGESQHPPVIVRTAQANAPARNPASENKPVTANATQTNQPIVAKAAQPAAPAVTRSTSPVDPTLPPPPNAPSITDTSLAAASAERSNDGRPLALQPGESKADLNNNLGRGQVLAAFNGVAPDGRWMFSVPQQGNTTELAKNDDVTKRRSARGGQRSRSTARRSGSPRFAHAAKKVVGFLNPFN